MSENLLTDEQVNAIQDTTLDGGVKLPSNEGDAAFDWDITYLLALYCLHRMSAASNALRVYHDSTDDDLECSVYAGRWFNGDTAVNYSGATNQTLTNTATNYIYVTAAGVLTINTTGFPVPTVTPHIPLATIVCAAGVWDPDADITDYRGRGIFTVCGASATESFSVYNDTGSSIPAGSALAICGYDSTNDMFEVELADADGTDKPAQAFAKAAIANADDGEATNQHDLTGVDTSAASAVGASVYLSDTAGEWTLTAPSGANQMKQEIGVVTVKDAATGAIRLKVGFGGSREKVGTDGLAALAVTAAKLAADAVETAKIKDGAVTTPKVIAGIEAKTAAYEVAVLDRNKIFTNEGATAEVAFTFHVDAIGPFEFFVQDSDGLKLTAPAGKTIRVAGEVSIAGGYVKSAAIGNAMRIIRINSTEFVALPGFGGTWTVETS